MGIVRGDFEGVTDGESAFQKFCGQANTTAPATPPPSDSTFTPGTALNLSLILKGFPKPQVITSDGTASGSYLNSARNSDVAVLFLNSFSPQTPAEFQAVI